MHTGRPKRARAAPSKELVKLLVALTGGHASALLNTHWPGDNDALLFHIKEKNPHAPSKPEWNELLNALGIAPPAAPSTPTPHARITKAPSPSRASISQGLDVAQRELRAREQQITTRERALESMRKELDIHESRLLQKEEQLRTRQAQFTEILSDNEMLQAEIARLTPRTSCTQTAGTQDEPDDRTVWLSEQNRVLTANIQQATQARSEAEARVAELEARLWGAGSAGQGYGAGMHIEQDGGGLLREMDELRAETERLAEQLSMQEANETARVTELNMHIASLSENQTEAVPADHAVRLAASDAECSRLQGLLDTERALSATLRASNMALEEKYEEETLLLRQSFNDTANEDFEVLKERHDAEVLSLQQGHESELQRQSEKIQELSLQVRDLSRKLETCERERTRLRDSVAALEAEKVASAGLTSVYETRENVLQRQVAELRRELAGVETMQAQQVEVAHVSHVSHVAQEDVAAPPIPLPLLVQQHSSQIAAQVAETLRPAATTLTTHSAEIVQAEVVPGIPRVSSLHVATSSLASPTHIQTTANMECQTELLALHIEGVQLHANGSVMFNPRAATPLRGPQTPPFLADNAVSVPSFSDADGSPVMLMSAEVSLAHARAASRSSSAGDFGELARQTSVFTQGTTEHQLPNTSLLSSPFEPNTTSETGVPSLHSFTHASASPMQQGSYEIPPAYPYADLFVHESATATPRAEPPLLHEAEMSSSLPIEVLQVAPEVVPVEVEVEVEVNRPTTLEESLTANRLLQQRIEDISDEKAALKRTLGDCLRATMNLDTLMDIERKFDLQKVALSAADCITSIDDTATEYMDSLLTLSEDLSGQILSERNALQDDIQHNAMAADTHRRHIDEVVHGILLPETAARSAILSDEGQAGYDLFAFPLSSATAEAKLQTALHEVLLSESDQRGAVLLEEAHLRHTLISTLDSAVLRTEGKAAALKAHSKAEAECSAALSTNIHQANEAISRRNVVLEEMLAYSDIMTQKYDAERCAFAQAMETSETENTKLAARSDRLLRVVSAVETQIDRAGRVPGSVAGNLTEFCRARNEDVFSSELHSVEEDERAEVDALCAAKVDLLLEHLVSFRIDSLNDDVARATRQSDILNADLAARSDALLRLNIERRAEEHLSILSLIQKEAMHAMHTTVVDTLSSRLTTLSETCVFAMEVVNVSFDNFTMLSPHEKKRLGEALEKDLSSAAGVGAGLLATMGVTPGPVQKSLTVILGVSHSATAMETPQQLARRIADKKAAGKIQLVAVERVAKELHCWVPVRAVSLADHSMPLPHHSATSLLNRSSASLTASHLSGIAPPTTMHSATVVSSSASLCGAEDIRGHEDIPAIDDEQLEKLRENAALAAEAAALDAAQAQQLAADWMSAYEAAIRWERAAQDAHDRLEAETEEVKKLAESLQALEHNYQLKVQESEAWKEKYDCLKRVAEEDLRRVGEERDAELCNAAELLLKLKIMHGLAVDEVALLTTELVKLQKEHVEVKTAVHVADQTLADVHRDLEIQKVARADGVRQLADDCRRVASELHGAQAEVRRFTELLEEAKAESADLATKLEASLTDAEESRAKAAELQIEKNATEEKLARDAAEAARMRQLLQQSRDRLQESAFEAVNLRSALSTTVENAKQKESLSNALNGDKERLRRQQSEYQKEVDQAKREKTSVVSQMQQELEGLAKQLSKAMQEARTVSDKHQRMKEASDKLAENLKKEQDKAQLALEVADSAVKKCDAAVAEAASATAAKDAAEKSLSDLQTAYDDDVGRLTRSVKRFEAEVAELSSQASASSTDNAALSGKVRELQAELDESAQHLTNIERELAQTSAQHADMSAKLEEVTAENIRLTKEVQRLETEGVRLKEDADAAERARLLEENSTLELQLRDAEASAVTLRKECEDLRQDTIAKTYELQGLTEAASDARTVSNEAGMNAMKERVAAETAKGMAKGLHDKLGAEQERVARLQEKLVYVDSENARLTSAVNTLSSQVEQLSEALLAESKESKMHDILTRAEELAALSTRELGAKLEAEQRLRQDANDRANQLGAMASLTTSKFLEALIERETTAARVIVQSGVGGGGGGGSVSVDRDYLEGRRE